MSTGWQWSQSSHQHLSPNTLADDTTTTATATLHSYVHFTWAVHLLLHFYTGSLTGSLTGSHFLLLDLSWTATASVTAFATRAEDTGKI